jgi:hypothetical protein
LIARAPRERKREAKGFSLSIAASSTVWTSVAIVHVRYSRRMHRILLAVLLAGCASAPRPLPAADWARHAHVFVDVPSGVPDDAQREEFKTRVEDDLRSAGALVEPQPQDQNLRVIAATNTNWTAIVVTALRGNDVLVRFRLVGMDLPCMSLGTAVGGGAVACIAREVSAQLLESKPLAAAMSRGPAPAVPQKPAPAGTLAGKLAVLELRNFAKDLTRENAQYFTDLVRGAALKSQPQLQVMTRENLIVLLQASGKKLEECEGECEVDTGRRIGADLIISGELQRVGTKYKMTLRLHDTHEGRLLASTQASGKSVDELDQDAQRAAEELLTLR